MAALEAVGAEIWFVSGLGLPDLIVRFRNRWYVLEVKTAKGALKPSQVDASGAAVFPVVRTADEALTVIGADGR